MTNEPNNNENLDENPLRSEEAIEEIFEDTSAENSDSSEKPVARETVFFGEKPGDVAVPSMTRKQKDRDFKTAVMPTDHDDADDYIFVRYRKKSTHRHSTHVSENKSQTQNSDNTDTPVASHSEQHFRYHASPKRKWKEMSAKQRVITVIALLLCAVFVLLATGGIVLGMLTTNGNKQLTNYDELNISGPSIEGVDITSGGKTVNYKGKTYTFNEDITSILCMGIDKTELGIDNNIVGTGGQADALYLVALNTQTGETDVIAISRDIVTDIGVYDPEGHYVGTEKMQLCLAYAYGDGKQTSCRNTVKATQRLFYGLPIQSYFSMDLSAIADINDAVGGVTVTLFDDTFTDANGVIHYPGETITLYGENAERYLRLRDVNELESSVNRMDRQINYLKAFSSQAIAMTKKDITTPLELLNIVNDNSVTNLNPSKITAFTTAVVTNGITELEFEKIPGTVTTEGEYARYVVDEEAFYEIIIDTFYTPAQ